MRPKSKLGHYREIDKLDVQQNDHKKEMKELVQAGFKDLSEEEADHREALEGKILNAIALKDARQKGWWEVLERIGEIALGTAVLAEGFKLIH